MLQHCDDFGHLYVQVERLQRKFATIHSTLAQQQTQKAPEPPASPLRSSVPSVAVSESLPKVDLLAYFLGKTRGIL